MAQIHPHINFNGNAEEAFLFYQSVFGGEISRIVRFGELDGFEVAEHEADKIMHIALAIGNGFLMGNDVPENMGRTNEHENRSKIMIGAESREEAARLYQGLSVGGQVEVPLDESAEVCFAMFRDRYGIEWMVEYNG
jgi:PhnB protein